MKELAAWWSPISTATSAHALSASPFFEQISVSSNACCAPAARRRNRTSSRAERAMTHQAVVSLGQQLRGRGV